MGRRCRAKDEPETLSDLFSALRIGLDRSNASIHAGIHRTTLYNWIANGEAADRKRAAALRAGVEPDLTEDDVFWCEFLDRLHQAESDTRAKCLDRIHQAGEHEWRANAWLLERLYPKDYAAHSSQSVEMQGEIKSGPDLSKLTDEQLWQLREIQTALGDDD